ncbi:MAG: YfhO family protein [Firmicutes bacterium]|nr:YfhO family protein [Bacillota bacterium]
MKTKILKYKFILAAFFLPILIMTAAFAVHGIFPFGGEQIAVIDLYHQYLPLISELQYKLHHGGSLFFTWNGLGGCNFWNIIAYQAGTPLNLILFLFPGKYIMEGITFVLLIKIGLAGAFMYIFLKSECPANDVSCRPAIRVPADIATLAFSTLYALNAYVMAYYWNVMWMDAVALLPLCILGLRRLTDGGKGVLYAVTLALIVVVNYYIAITVCIFLLLYYLTYYFERSRIGRVKGFVITTGRVAVYSAIGLAMSAFMLLPTYYSMKHASVMDSTFPEDTYFYKDAIEVVNQLLPNAKLSYLEGLPNIYCGMAVLIMFVFYFGCRQINIREKVANTLLLVFLFLSLNVNVLDYIWHGFHYPNMLPFRYSFMVCFLLIFVAYKTFRRIDDINGRFFGIVFGAGLIYYLMAQKLMKDIVDDHNMYFYIGVLWLALFSALFLAYRRGFFSFRAMKYILLFLVVAEMSFAAIYDTETVGHTTKETYDENMASMEELLEDTRGEFARVEIDDALTINEPARLHYKGLSQFASSMRTTTSGFMQSMGLEAEENGNRSVYVPTNPVTNALFNIKYMLSKYDNFRDPDFKKVRENEDSGLYESKYPLAVGYMASDSINTFSAASFNPFDNLNEYVRLATDNRCSDVLIPAGEYDISGTNGVFTNDSFCDYHAEIVDAAGECEAKLSVTAEATQKYYVFVDCPSAETIVYQKGDSVDRDEIDENYSGIVNVGVLKEGEDLNIEITLEKGKSGDITAYFYYLDQNEWDKAYSILSASTLDVTEFGDTYLKGTVDAGNGGTLATSIAYDEGWKVYVDGHEKRTFNLIDNAMISISLGEGVHEIEMKFMPQGFLAGVGLTILAILLLAALILFGDRIRETLVRVCGRKKEQAESTAESTAIPSDTEIADAESDSAPPKSDES